MNRPAHPIAAEAMAGPAYEADAYGWAMAQARLIRERRFNAIDWENVAEEIESVGRSEYAAGESLLRIVLLHQLKWSHQELFRSRSWSQSIHEHLRRFDRLLGEYPGLKPRLDEIRAEAYRRARHEAAQQTGLALRIFPINPPSWDEIRAPLPE